MRLTKDVTQVFANDDYGGLVMIELDWQQDDTWERGELNDGYESIEDYFNNKTVEWYDSIKDWFYEMDEFTEFEIDNG